MKTRHFAVLILIVFSVASCTAAKKTGKPNPELAFKTAAALMKNGQPREAIPYLEQVKKEYPDNTAMLWNLGMAQAETGNHSGAIRTWKHYLKVTTNDWRALAKLVQAQQGAGDLKARDESLKEMYALRVASGTSDIVNAEKFCREQWITPAGQRVLAFEYFDPKGPHQRFYRFSVADAAGNEDFYISLGSYDDTTSIAQELGEISKSTRLYHLDKYNKATHKTYVLFESRPNYDKIRINVVAILEGKMKPISASMR